MHGNIIHPKKYKFFSQKLATVSPKLLAVLDFGLASLLINMVKGKPHCWLSVKSMTPIFVVVVYVLLPICCHIGSGMPYLRILLRALSHY